MTNKLDPREFEFVLVLDRGVELTSKFEDAIYGGRCDDATISVRYGRIHLAFARRDKSAKDAIISAIRDFRSCGDLGRVVRIDECDLVTQS
ncbi:MAG: hypothetical protein KDA60_21315, partial [Planctomycetales bacterium]|nr:hypothetical protein [Planctomycetales bacterium]